VTDRLAYLNFVKGSLASSLAQKLNTGRGPLKALREAENGLLPRKSARANLFNLVAKLENDHQKGSEKRIAELREQLKKAEQDCEIHEKELEILKRKAIKDSETAKWEAIREVTARTHCDSNLSLTEAMLVRREACPFVASRHPGHCGLASYSAFFCKPLHGLTSYCGCSCCVTASTR
jgi:hypothetical protein